ncbi:S-layer homology domain-containing protein [Paenibacillus sp. 19GGS1-52]|nr:S-layer homology domain-containing protein [Paenibacillus sp. 19GGS1-52]
MNKAYLATQPVGTTSLTFTFSAGATQTLVITVSDTTPQNSVITPATGSFDKKTSAQADVTTTLTLNGNTLSGIANGVTPLVLGTDYTVSGTTVTISKDYLATQPVGTTSLTFTFSAGATQTLAITVSDTTPLNSVITPAIGSFDKKTSAQADVTTTLTLNGNTLIGIANGVTPLVLGTDYTVSGTTVTISKDYLVTQPVGITSLTFTFSAGASQTLAITVSDTTPLNSVITPATGSFDKKTSAQADVTTTLTLNSNTLSGIANGVTPLVLGTDYTVSGTTVTINKAYLATQPVGTTSLTFTFSAGATQTLVITVSDTTPLNSVITPATGSFDKKTSAQADVTTTLTLNGNTLIGIANGVTPLVLGTDYTVSGTTVTISKDYLATQPVGTTSLTFTFSAGATQTLVITVSDSTVVLPGVPLVQSAIAGNAQVSLSWSAVEGSSGYKIYQSLTSGTYGNEVATVSGSVYSYNATGLINGTKYYFVVRATNLGGDSASSNEMNATPKTVPMAPTNINAIAGNGQVTVSFTPPTDNGGSLITGYAVIDSLGNILATGTNSPITITGLSNGVTYTFTVKAINSAGSSVASVLSNAVTPVAPSTPTQPTQPSTPSTPETTTGVDILVNGKVENAGTATTVTVNQQSVTTVVIDQKKLEDKLAAEGQGAVITIPVNLKSDVVVGELTGEMVKSMEQKQAILEIKTASATYTLPAQQINIDSISAQIGKTVALQDIKIQIEIAVPTADVLKRVQDSAAKGDFTEVMPPLEFTVRAIYGDTTIAVTKFNAYVERTVAIPDGVDPNRITTGIVVDPDGTVRHVPTKIVVIDGKYFAKLNSLTNSTYSIVWHPLEFKDVANHWAKEAVNNMGSRLVIDGVGNDMFNPDQDITRAEFAAIIVRGLGLKLENGATPFADVKAADWYSSAVQTAFSYNLINGFEDGSFRPTDKITREQAMVIIAKAMKITALKAKLPTEATGALLNPYADAAKASEWAKNSIADSLQAGIVSGRSATQLAPKAYITRAEVAAMIERLLQKSDLI